ncbi:Na+/H+ antiporter subunit E [Nonomuraea sp. LPB2021202275-12-8]|uniref:Na+/H+ antiporter subunit E n=1 Tax=Nonomuraea sp. LPB2021202275-12-8 TaxID=3120159 RepID=UPI00300DB255
MKGPAKGFVPRVFGRPVPPALVAWLALIWVMLWGEVSAGTVLGGLVTGAITTWLLPLPVLDPGIRIRPLRAVSFLLWFAADLVSSTARVVFWVLRSGSPPAGIVRVRLRTSSESMIMMIMVAVSTVPGSLVLEVDEGSRELVLHVLGRTGDLPALAQQDVTRLESRIVSAFGTRADLEELR